jgi:hypothetical protein
MNPEVKAAWIAALRSGKYKQGRQALRVGDFFCCLGVLCDVLNDNLWNPHPGSGRSVWGTNSVALSYSTLESIGLTDLDQSELITLNDDIKASFDAIAKFIEDEL